ncbi:OsmC family protein [Pseudovibrio exalbescens]|uniref:OsmC family protein n=1 Tax=Pseudovibrio exalbescens TaxID=197461 RepID=UPI002366A09A|nr:OsmC family protein [Pseudovibrio exalbescens]MDD7912080.1 OsmC family protein [Pseudovibrio exalbescens]
MAIKIKPKSFGPLTLSSNGDGSYTTTTDAGNVSLSGAPATAEVSAPYDLIMAALGSCVGVSLEMAAKQKKLEPGNIDITVNAAKAEDLPSRFGRFDVTVALDGIEDDEVALGLLNLAKEMCTVSNTLNAEITLSLHRDADKGGE